MKFQKEERLLLTCWKSKHFETKIQLKALSVFKKKLVFLKKQNVEEFERTRRKSGLNVDLLNFDAKIKLIDIYVIVHRNMSDIARILQAVQICHQI